MIYVREDLKPLFSGERDVADFMRIDGELFKDFPSRRTLRFERRGKQFFIKNHKGFGWKGIIRKLLSFRVPVVSAKNEWRAIRALEALGLNTMKIAAYGEEGINPAARKSFIVTEAITGTESLEKWAPKFLKNAVGAQNLQLKRALIRNVSEIARRLHTNGLNHRDFYLCHLLLDLSSARTLSTEHLKLYLIDLHRMQVRKHTPRRWAVKDVAGIFFSSMDLGLTARDFFRFMKGYSDKPLRATLESDSAFWRSVYFRAIRLYHKQHGRLPTLPKMIHRP